MQTTRDALFDRQAAELGHRFDGEIRIGGNYVSVLRQDSHVYVSGQIPRVGETLVVVGCVGADVDLARARHAAKVCAMRALVLLRQELGGLDKIGRILRMTVYVHCSEHFTQLSEVGDAASELLHAVLGDAGRHTRTSVGVRQLPKNAPVELDLIAAVA